jgi:hypothetical protein
MNQVAIHPLETIFGQVNGSSIISIDTETIPVLLGGKKNPMQGQIRKVTIGNNVMVFQNKNTNAYENMVERRLIGEGKDPTAFQLSPRSWGRRIEATPFIEHNGAMYLEVIFLRAGVTHYEHGVRPIDKEMIEGLNEKAVEAEQGGLDNKVVIRSFKFDSVRAVKVNGVLHIIR